MIGAAKSGTTTLHAYLERHPGVYLCQPKEPEFFSDDRVFTRGLDWYRGLFAGAAEGQLCGEASTTYTRWPHTADAAQRIAAAVPDARLIYIMRHPVERAYSHYAHHMRLGVTKSFEAALEESSIYVDCGMYMAQIARYLRWFPRESFLFLLSEDLRADAGATLLAVQRFLGLKALDLTSGGLLTANQSGPDHFIRSRTTGRLRAVPGMSALIDRIPRRWREGIHAAIKRSPIGRRLQQGFVLPPMLPATRQRLLTLFEPANRELADFLGRDLGAWAR